MSVIFVFVSCQNELKEEIASKKVIDAGNVEFVYKNTTYSLSYTINSDSTIVWSDETAGKLYETLQDLPTLATLVNENGQIELFDSYSDLPIVKDENPLRQLGTNVYEYGYAPKRLYLYADNDKGGTVKIWNASRRDNKETIELGSLMPLLNGVQVPDRFDNVLSSFELVDTRVLGYYSFLITLFENENFGGKSITFKAENVRSNRFCINRLSSYTMKNGFLGIGKKSWNDQVSSIKYLWL
jgi:hypothetical protein